MIRPASDPSERVKTPTFSGFAFRLLLYLFLVSLLFSLLGLHETLLPVQRWMASSAASGARAIGANATVNETIIRTDHAALDINHECTGIFVLLVYTMFVLAYPAPWGQRLSGTLVGWITLLTINLIRLVFLTYIASQRPDWFAYFHEYFFQGLFIALLAILASLWTEQVRRASLHQLPT
jgi:archaeosortase B (VPXXXP-CTERM-specific)